jgi:hypothetical protein
MVKDQSITAGVTEGPRGRNTRQVASRLPRMVVDRPAGPARADRADQRWCDMVLSYILANRKHVALTAALS